MVHMVSLINQTVKADDPITYLQNQDTVLFDLPEIPRQNAIQTSQLQVSTPSMQD